VAEASKRAQALLESVGLGEMFLERHR
jgi:hypothetical protein